MTTRQKKSCQLTKSCQLLLTATKKSKKKSQKTVIVEVPGGIIDYGRAPDGRWMSGHEFSDDELIPGDDVGLSDEDLRRAAERAQDN